jgi:hypothetical protein
MVVLHTRRYFLTLTRNLVVASPLAIFFTVSSMPPGVAARA